MINDILNKMSLEEKVGQLCVPILQSDRITDEIREAIEQGRYKEYKEEKLAKMSGK